MSKALDSSEKQNAQYNNSLRDLKRQLNTGQIDFDSYRERLRQLNQSAADSQDAFTRLGISTRNFDGTLKNPKQILESLFWDQ